jgi:hypothetical protein
MIELISQISINALADIATVIGLPIAVIVLFLTWRNVRGTERIAEAQLWLDFRRQLAEYHDVHTALAPGGGWHEDSGYPATQADLRRLEAYMGLLEHCKIMLDNGLLARSTFRSVYQYRLINLAANPFICEEKLAIPGGWPHLISLLKEAGIPFKGNEPELPDDEWPRMSLHDAFEQAQKTST